MNETIDCTNCCIADFKHSLCDCHGDFCTKYKSIGDENDFMQAVLADRPQGEWIEQEDDYHHYWECSECGMGVGLDDIRNFCPHCGAHMKGADNDTD